MSKNGKIPKTETRGQGGIAEFRASFIKERTACEKVTHVLCHALCWTALLVACFSMVRCALS